jgi:hypothetical protein
MWLVESNPLQNPCRTLLRSNIEFCFFFNPSMPKTPKNVAAGFSLRSIPFGAHGAS